MDNQPIGIIDSGVGGLSIWQEIRRELPHESTIYIADSKNCPYGTKSAEEIYPLASRLVTFLLQQNVKMIVLACNTITVSCLEKLRSNHPHVPFIGVVPVIKTAVAYTATKTIGVLTTPVTEQSEYQKKLLAEFAQDCQVITVGSDTLVPFVERGELRGEAVTHAVKNVLTPFMAGDCDVVALGCTHFPFLKPIMVEVAGEKMRFFDSGAAVARHVKRTLTNRHIVSKATHSTHALYTTGNRGEFHVTLQKLFSRDVLSSIRHIEQVTL